MRRGRCSATLSCPEAADQRETSRLVGGIEDVDQFEKAVRRQRRAALQAKRILDAAAIFDMRVIGLARTVADPDHVAGRRVPVARGGIDARERLLVTEQQSFVAGEEIRFTQARMVFSGDADRLHEIHRLGDPVGELAVALCLRAVLDETEHPLMDVLEIGVTAHGKGAQQVERRRGLAIGHDLTFRIGHACLLRELYAVDDVAAVARQRHIALLLDARRARLGELAGNAAHLDDRLLRTEGQDDGHLQEGAEEISDRIGAMLGEALGAVAPLQQEAAPLGNVGKRALETARLSGEDKWRILGKTRFHAIEHCEVRIVRHLLNGFLPPAVRSPSLCHFHHLLSDADRPASRPAAVMRPGIRICMRPRRQPCRYLRSATTPGRTTFADAGL